jgi:hypothetical protein
MEQSLLADLTELAELLLKFGGDTPASETRERIDANELLAALTAAFPDGPPTVH